MPCIKLRYHLQGAQGKTEVMCVRPRVHPLGQATDKGMQQEEGDDWYKVDSLRLEEITHNQGQVQGPYAQKYSPDTAQYLEAKFSRMTCGRKGKEGVT